MKIGIFYFSGTGNTKYIAKQIEKNLCGNNDVSIYSIEDAIEMTEYELVIIGGPIYAGNVPEKLIRWVLRNVPNTNNGKAILFTSSAGLLNANGTKSLAKKLTKKGYTILSQLQYQMPRNYYFNKYSIPTKEEIKHQYYNVQYDVEKDLKSVLAIDGISYNESVLGYDIMAELMSVMTRFMGKSFSANEDCTKCGKCVKSCPTNNIVLKDKISFKLNCMMCTRCIHSCPTNAIEYKNLKVIQYQPIGIK